MNRRGFLGLFLATFTAIFCEKRKDPVGFNCYTIGYDPGGPEHSFVAIMDRSGKVQFFKYDRKKAAGQTIKFRSTRW